ncbi:peptide/nickel transport system permease protein [Rhizobium sp. BK313]|jgi:peptide/nickel transport system permease protein|uniref:ABC transporter permease n=1 Tax=Rhizobium sp. BK313 TaxID=2587081 RepID=UPI00105ED70F|nr:ABC transporter permease [Rhizobium sp. BK313]MBB3454299.1 peptide/nickel transport system permease protein [Rhizobium sp. BK313]
MISLFLAKLARNWLGVFGAAIILAAIAIAVFAPLVAPMSMTAIDLHARLSPPSWVVGGSPKHLLGTDNIGRDILSRLIYGSRISLAVGTAAALLGAVLGSLMGLLAGYFGGRVDTVISWCVDVQLAFPFTLLAIFLLGTFGGGFTAVVFVLALATWVNYARVVRSQVLTVKVQDYVTAARSVGVGTTRTLLRYILPNATAPIIVVASFSTAQAILTQAALSFLGVGIDASIPSWGAMLNDGRDYLQSAWWIATFPGLAIALTVLGVNLFGDWLRDTLDPRSLR